MYEGTPTQAGAAQPLLGGRYRLLGKVGEGGAAEVFRAIDTRLDRVVAVKLLRPQFTSDQQSRARFAVEARAAAGLSHHNIVDVYDFGEALDGSMFIVMQFVEGQNLRDLLLERGRFSPGEVVSIAQQVCRALSVAHANGLIHRDVKPQNIMLDRAGNVRLTDFGVVKALSSPGLTQSGMTFGTAAYLSPEQATGAAIGPPSDIYALGCVMYEMLSGMPPFTGDNPAIVAYKQVWEQPRPLHDLAPEVPPSLEAVVMRCLNKDPGRRYPTANDLAAELERLTISFTQPTQAVPVPSAGYATPGSEYEQTPKAQVSQAIPMPLAAGDAGPAVPPVRAQTTGYNGTPTPGLATAPYAGPAGSSLPVVTVNDRRGLGWLPVALLVLALVGLCGLAAWQGRNFLPAGILGAGATPTVPVVGGLPPEPTASPTLGQVVEGSPVTSLPTNTPVPPTATSPPPPTDTPAPVPPTDTPAPPPTDTPVPPPPTDTPVPPPPPPPVNNTITLEDNAFVGGYTRSDGMYHRRTAHWVYGQGTDYHTMSASFNLDQVPDGPINLTIVGVDSEDDAKTPMRLLINSTVIYEGANPLPDDTRGGVNAPGNWGSYTWQFNSAALQPGTNTLTVSNLDPSDRINYPIFIMVDYAAISW